MNMSIEKEFIPFEQALALKELGLNEPCFGFYVPLLDGTQELEIKLCETHGKIIILAPTFSQTFRWFREKYGLFAAIDGLEERLYYKITQTNEYSKEYNTYEEAELECLKKLIEIVKNK
jgi:hypothetical protein